MTLMQFRIDYPDEPGTDDEHEDPEEDPSEEHEPKNEDANKDESFEDSDKTDPFEENETVATPLLPRSPQTRIPFSQTRLRRARKTVMRLELPMPASMEARIAWSTHHVRHLYLSPALSYDQHHGIEILLAAWLAEIAPRGQYDFIDAIGAGQGLIRSPGHDVQTITRAADRA
ncbi:hypothetical protein Tco_0694484 [Tanacetum coccineum]